MTTSWQRALSMLSRIYLYRLLITHGLLKQRGGFLELTLSSVIDYGLSEFTFTPYITQAFDFGYATSDYNGPNNIQAGIEAVMSLKRNLSLGININHSWAQGDVDRDDGGDVTWFGIALKVDI